MNPGNRTLPRCILPPTIMALPPACMALPQTVDYVDLKEYAGLWCIIARYPAPFDFTGDAVAVTTTYTILEDGRVRVLNQGLVGSLDRPPINIEGFVQAGRPGIDPGLYETLVYELSERGFDPNQI